ncbi:MAG: hypothetical protein WC914_01695 [Proteiniphilum sp.]
MSHFFIHNISLICGSYENFKIGVEKLVEIQQKENHAFYKHSSCYEIDYFLNGVFPNLNLPQEKMILDYFEKLTTCDTKIECEVSAMKYCNSEMNGFLGINFEEIDIAFHKKITNQECYENWIQYYQSGFEKIVSRFPNVRYTNKFQKTFNELSNEVQNSIVRKLNDAIAQNCINQPNGILVKEVSLSGRCKVLEIRVYSPVALRVYFNFENDIVSFASIEQKSNPDQNEDIRNAERLLMYLRSR